MIKYLNRDVIILFLCLLLSLLLYFSSKSTVVYSVKAEIADFISLDFYDEQPWSLKIAKVVNDNYSYLMRTITINLGMKDGLESNLPVVDINGLIGKIEVSSDRASKVQLITDKNFVISVRVGSDMVVGEFKATHKGLGIIYGVRKTANVEVGDIVYTSGVSTIYPSSIPVAKVVRINKNNDTPFQDIEVQILADLINFNHVFVVL